MYLFKEWLNRWFEEHPNCVYRCGFDDCIYCEHDIEEAFRAGMLAAAEIAEKPMGNGLCSRDDVWQPKIAKAIREAAEETDG